MARPFAPAAPGKPPLQQVRERRSPKVERENRVVAGEGLYKWPHGTGRHGGMQQHDRRTNAGAYLNRSRIAAHG